MKKTTTIPIIIFAIFSIFQLTYASQIDSLIKVLGDKDVGIQESAERSLTQIGEPAEEAIVDALKSNNPVTRRRAGFILAKMGNPKAIESLLETMTGTDKPAARKAAKALAQMRCPEAIPLLMEMLKDTSSSIHKQGKDGLTSIGEPAFKPVLALLKSKSAGIRIAAIEILAGMHDKRAIAPLIELIGKDKAARPYVVTALGILHDTSTVPLLIGLLNDQDGYVRKMAAQALSAIGDERAIEPLINVFKDQDPSVPIYAVSGLTQFGDKVLTSLIKSLSDEDPVTQKYAIMTLGNIKNEKALKPIQEIIKNKSGDIEVRKVAVTALGSIGGKKVVSDLSRILQYDEQSLSETASKELVKLGEDGVSPLIRALASSDLNVVKNAKDALVIIGKSALPALIRTLSHNDPKVRENIIEVLSSIGDKRASPHVVKRLSDPVKSVQIAAIVCLGKIGDEQAIQSLVRYVGTKDSDIKLNAIKSLSMIGTRAGDKAVIELMKVIKKEKGEIQKEAVIAIGKIKSKKATLTLIELLATKDVTLKKVVIAALGDIKDETATEPLLKSLTHDHPDIRRQAIIALGNIGTKASIEPILGCLKDPANNVRLEAAIMLSYNADKLEASAIIPLLEAMRVPDEYQQRLIAYVLSNIGESAIGPLIIALNDEQSDIRRYAARALGAIRNTRAVDPLIKALNDIDSEVRAAAAGALGEIKDNKAVEPLIKYLTDEDRKVKISTAWALGNINDTRAAMPLNIALNDKDPLVRNAAAAALGKLSGSSCAIITSITKFDIVSFAWAAILGVFLLLSFFASRIKPLGRFFQKVRAKYALPVKAKWWITFVLGLGALALFIYCYVCKTGEGAAVFALKKPGFLPTLYLYSLRTFPFFIGGCILSGFILRYFSGRRRLPSSMLGATTFGVLMPLCSCAVIPMARGMLASRLPVRAVIAYLIIDPILGPFTIFMSYGIIGLKYTLVRIVSAYAIAIFGGLFIERVVGREELEKDADFMTLCKGCAQASTVHDATSSPLIIAWNQIGYLLKYMILGIFLGALLEQYLPVALVAKFMSSSILGLFAAVTVGVPLYLCSGQEVLLLKPLMDMGLPLGHAIAFTITSTGICLTSIALLVGAIGKKTTIWMTLIFWVGSFVLGYLINLIL